MEQNRKLAKNAFWAKDGQGNEAYLYANGEITSGVKYEKEVLAISILDTLPEELLALDLCNIIISDRSGLYFIDVYGNAIYLGTGKAPCRPIFRQYSIVVDSNILAQNGIDITEVMQYINNEPLGYQVHVNNQFFLATNDDMPTSAYNLLAFKNAFEEIKTATQTILNFSNITLYENDVITLSFVDSSNYCQ